MSFVVPTSSGNATWYGWHFVQDNMAHLFKGNIVLGANGAAESNNNGILSFSSDNPWTNGSGSVDISQGSLNSFQATLNYTPLGTAPVTVSLSATSPANNVYQYNQSASVLSLAGIWTGVWSSAGNVIGGDLTFNNDGTLDVNTVANFVNCNVNATAPNGLKLVSVTGANYFTLTVTLPQSLCTWSTAGSKTLTGIGFIHASGIPLTPDRLELMLIDSNGRGIISYRGVK